MFILRVFSTHNIWFVHVDALGPCQHFYSLFETSVLSREYCVLLKDMPQCVRWGWNQLPLILKSSILPLSHYAIHNIWYYGKIRNSLLYSGLSLPQLCITQYYHLSRLDGPVPVFSPIYYCNSTTFISTTAKSIKLITCYKKLVLLINFSVFYNS